MLKMSHSVDTYYKSPEISDLCRYINELRLHDQQVSNKCWNLDVSSAETRLTNDLAEKESIFKAKMH